jgi:hypothetical protein
VARELRVHSVPSRAEQIRTIVEIVALVLAGLWALYTFVYEQRIKPLSEQASFEVPTTVEQGPTIRGNAILTIHKRFENTGNVPIDVAGETLSVFGESLGSRPEMHSDITATDKYITGDVPRRITRLLYSNVRLRRGAVGGNPGENFLLLPHTSAEETIVVAVPVKTYPLIRVSRRDYVGKFPISPQIKISVARDSDGGYVLSAPREEGEYDNYFEYGIKQ